MKRALNPDLATELWPRRLPDWLARAQHETLENTGFSAGAALALLDMMQHNPALPAVLWRARLALMAAAHIVALSGRPEREAALRDILCLLRRDEQPGPAGTVALAWKSAAVRPLSQANLTRAIPELSKVEITCWNEQGHGAPVAQAACVLEAVLTEAPRNYSNALILADAALARAMGWQHVVPLLGRALPRRVSTLHGDDLRLACHKAIVTSVAPALSLAADLTRRAAQLNAVTPRLRSKQAAAAVDMFLTRDAIAPAALTGLMSGRAARRFCDRLVALGAVRELTGRETFRLYGV